MGGTGRDARRFGIGALFAAVASLLGACAAPEAGDDPVSVSAPRRPNWALAAPTGVRTVTDPTRESPRFDAPPERLIAAFEAAALADSRVTRLDNGSDPHYRSFVQRSALVGFPDVISARAVRLPNGGSGLVVYSRSVYGYSDQGVNKARVDRWLRETAARM